MVFDELIGLINIIQMNSYFFIFIIMVIEGPVVSIISAYLASLGFLNVWIILIISILGNLIPDIFLYFIGRYSRTKKIESYIKRFGLKDCQIINIEENIKKHFGKTFSLIKITPMLPVPGLILVGFSRIPFKKFLIIDILFNLMVSTIFILFGYYFGYAIDSIFKYFRIGQFSIFGLILLIGVVYLVYRKIKIK